MKSNAQPIKVQQLGIMENQADNEEETGMCALARKGAHADWQRMRQSSKQRKHANKHRYTRNCATNFSWGIS